MLKRPVYVLAIFVLSILSFNIPTEVCAQTTGNNTVYEVFVRSFYDSNGDGVGDLNGLRQRLDYLNDGNPDTDTDLEIGILWLMPIFPSSSYHGYNVTNYRKIDPAYGDLQDFDELIIAAKERGIRVILDIPFNHTSNQHPWFKDAIDHPTTSPYRNWYFVKLGERPNENDWYCVLNTSGQQVCYFADFGKDMPDLDMSNPKVRDEAKKIAQFWLDHGAEGFRLDAAKHIFAGPDGLSWQDIQKNNAWWKEFSQYVYSIKASAIIVGEVLSDEQTIHHFAWGLDAILDSPFMHRIRKFVSFEQNGLLTWWKNYLAHARTNNAKFNLYPYVASHDENPRLASYLQQHAPAKLDQQYRIAMYLLLTMGKYPVLYYGDELMQQGWKWKGDNPPHGDGSQIYDETLREPFQWYRDQTGTGQTTWFLPRFDHGADGISVEEQGSSKSMRRLVAALTNFRAHTQAFANGEMTRILEDTSTWLVFEKQFGQSRFLVLCNASDAGKDYVFHEQWYPEYSNAQLLFWSDGMEKTWADVSVQDTTISNSVYIPKAGLVILKQR